MTNGQMLPHDLGGQVVSAAGAQGKHKVVRGLPSQIQTPSADVTGPSAAAEAAIWCGPCTAAAHLNPSLSTPDLLKCGCTGLYLDLRDCPRTWWHACILPCQAADS